ncbi:MAG TPA: hypothetical protein PLY43_02610 [Ruminococcus sp.]|nr:hypothetical protein [Ruminococcus sp.]HOR21595.1 hypothetical protein [Ruminococcus sp.]
MSKKAKIILAVSITSTVIAAGATTAALLICKKLYEKNYFSAD